MTKNIPVHLNDLLGYSVGRWKKLIAAWNGLTFETQILILNKITSELDYHNEIKDEFFIKAFNSENDYIRYLVAKWLMENRNEEIKKSGLWKNIENDPSELVRNCKYENHWEMRHIASTGENIQDFWNLPEESRLAWARSIKSYDGKRLKNIVESLVNVETCDQKKEAELSKILEEVACHLFREPNSHHWGEWDEEEPDFRLLRFWEIIPLLRGMHPLLVKEYLENIPYLEYEYGIDEIIENCVEPHLEYLLYRPELKLKELRKKLFFDKNASDDLKAAATRDGLISYDDEGNEVTEEELNENEEIEGKFLEIKEEIFKVADILNHQVLGKLKHHMQILSWIMAILLVIIIFK